MRAFIYLVFHRNGKTHILIFRKKSDNKLSEKSCFSAEFRCFFAPQPIRQGRTNKMQRFELKFVFFQLTSEGGGF